jgi:hypothetical protein
MKQILILCHTDDLGAIQVSEIIASKLGKKAVSVITPEVFALVQWSHCVDSSGQTTTRFRIPNQQDLDSEFIGCLFNRLRYVPSRPFTSQKNRDYAGAEIQALMSSWLLQLGEHLVNPISIISGIASPISHPQWMSAAQQSRLPIFRYVKTTAQKLIDKILPGEVLYPLADWPGKSGVIPAEIMLDHAAIMRRESILVCGDQALGSLAQMFGDASIRLAKKMQHNLLEIHFGLIQGEFRVIEISPYPLLESSEAVNGAAKLIMDLAFERDG